MASGNKNWALSSEGATLAVVATSGATYTNESFIHDASEDSASMCRRPDTGAEVDGATVTYTITLPHTIVLTKLSIRCAGGGYKDREDPPDCHVDYYDGAWNIDLASFRLVEPAKWYNSSHIAGIPSVTEIRVVVTGLDVDRDYAWHGLSYERVYNRAWIYDVQAWGHFFDDGAVAGSDLSDGIRIWDGTANVDIAMEALDGHKVRVRGSDGVTYGVPLVATTHSSASKVRIYDGTEVKSFVEIT